jgi:hypothetical protein
VRQGILFSLHVKSTGTEGHGKEESQQDRGKNKRRKTEGQK